MKKKKTDDGWNWKPNRCCGDGNSNPLGGDRHETGCLGGEAKKCWGGEKQAITPRRRPARPRTPGDSYQHPTAMGLSCGAVLRILSTSTV